MHHWGAAAIAIAAGLAAKWVCTKLMRQFVKQRPLERAASPPSDGDTAVVTSLFVFPIKGVGGMAVDEWPLGPHGLLWDRHWALALPREDGTYVAVSSNRLQKLASASASIDQAGTSLKVCAPGMELLSLDIDHNAREGCDVLRVELFGMWGTAMEESVEATAWWRLFLAHERVVFLRISDSRLPESSPSHQGCPVESEDAIGFHDYAALHIITQEGVAWLRTAIPTAHQVPGFEIDDAQFRANVVVGGLPFPDEDTWLRLSIGSISFRVAKQSGRCVIPTHNAAGERHPYFEPTATLRRLRRAFHRHQLDRPVKDGMFMFGLDLFSDGAPTELLPPIMRVGDRMVVLQRQAPPDYF